MQSTVCGQCGASWASPDMLTEALRGSVASWARAGKHVMATQQMNTVSRLTVHDAMAIVLHITHEPGICHYCSYPLTGEATDHCPFCQAVNYDW
jgi:rubrerythrin